MNGAFFAAYDGDRMIGTAILFSFLLDNTEKAWAVVNVDVPERRRGVGRALVEHVEQLVRADGRTTLMTASHLPFDDREDQTMTNATVSATVQGAKGHELTVSYEGGSQKVVVADGAVISALGPGQRSQLVPGAYASVTAEPGADGKLTARNIEVRKETPKAPM